MSSDVGNSIHARFVVTEKVIGIYAAFRQAEATMRWPRNSDGSFDKEAVVVLLSNLPDLLANCIDEAMIRDETRRLDTEISELLGDSE